MRIRQEALDEYRREAGEQTTELTRIAQVAYQEGELGILELLDALRTGRQARIRVGELEAAWREAQLELERFIGEEIVP